MFQVKLTYYLFTTIPLYHFLLLQTKGDVGCKETDRGLGMTETHMNISLVSGNVKNEVLIVITRNS